MGRRVLTLAVVSTLIAAGSLARPWAQQATFRSGTSTVPVYATVFGADGHLATGLTKYDFELFDNGRLVPVALFTDDLVPITVSLMIDTSSSMAHEALRVRRSASEFVDRLLPADRVRIGTFGEEVALSPHLTADKSRLQRIIQEEIWPGGETPLWTALLRGMQSLKDEGGRRVVLALTDGGDVCTGDRPCAKLGDVRNEIANGGFMVYGVGMAGAPLAGDLVKLIEASGGGHFDVADNANLTESFTRVAEELHQQYLLGFTPRVLDGKVHTIQLKVKKPGYTARARNSYFAPKGTK